MKSRQDLMEGRIKHREYYAQFIDSDLTAQVINRIGVSRIKNSTDPHFNDYRVVRSEDHKYFTNRLVAEI